MMESNTHFNHQASTKSNLNNHQSRLHEDVKYPCRQCNYQANSKGDLNKHQRSIHEGVKYTHAGNATIKQLQREILLSSAHEGVKYS